MLGSHFTGRVRQTNTSWCACAISVALAATASTQMSPPAAPGAGSSTLRREALELGYNLDRAEAIAAFDRAIGVDPGNPTNYRLAAGALWSKMLFDQGAVTVEDYLGQARATVERQPPDPDTVKAFHTYADRAEALAADRLRRHPDDAAAHFEAGAVAGLMASYTATIEGRVAGSVGAARRAYREQERALELDPARKDAGLIVGLYTYSIAELSLTKRMIARLAGFSADRERGIRLLEDAAWFPSDAQPGALFSLNVVYNRERRYADALTLIETLQRMFPRNRLLWLEESSTALRAGDGPRARAAAEAGWARLLRDTRPRASGEISRWHYVYGAALAATGDAARAAIELHAAADTAVRDWVRGRSQRELGRLALAAGDRTGAATAFTLAESLCRKDADEACATEARVLLKQLRSQGDRP